MMSLLLGNQKSMTDATILVNSILKSKSKLVYNNFTNTNSQNFSKLIKPIRKREPHHYKTQFTVTSYTDSPSENGWGKITYLGIPLKRGIAACDPKYVPLRSKIFIPSMKRWFYCADTGSKVKGRHFDLLMSRSEERRFGRQHLQVIVYPAKTKIKHYEN